MSEESYSYPQAAYNTVLKYIQKKFGLTCAIENKAKKNKFGKTVQVWTGVRFVPEKEEDPSTGDNLPLDASSDITTVMVET